MSDSSYIRLSKIFLCAPVPFESLRLTPTETGPANAVQLGLVHSLIVTPVQGGGAHIELIRKFESDPPLYSFMFPFSRHLRVQGENLGISHDGKFNLYYQSLRRGVYLEGCDDSNAVLSLKVDLDGEYEVAKFTADKYMTFNP